MIKIKKFKEKWVAGTKYKIGYSSGYFEIFKNPTVRELKEANKYEEVRGLVLRNGEFYIVKPSNEIVHSDLIHILNKVAIIEDKWVRPFWWKEEDFMDYFVCVVQIKKTSMFKFADSYGRNSGMINPDIIDEYKVNFEKENSNYTLKTEYL